MRKHLNVILAFTVLVSSTLVFTGCSSNKPVQAATESQIPSVKVIKIGASAGVGVSGKIVPDQQVQLISKVSGRVASVNVEEGAKVKKGDILVQLESDDLADQVNQAAAGVSSAQAKLADTQAGARAQDIQAAQSAVEQAKAGVELAKANVDQAKASFDLVQKTVNHIKNGYDNGENSKDDLDKATLDFTKAQSGYDSAISQKQSAAAQLTSARAKLDLLKAGATSNTIGAMKAEVSRTEAALELAKYTLSNAAIVAPMDGIVVKRSVNPGDMAFTNSTTGTALLTLVSMNQVKVEVSVPEDLISQVKDGATVEVRVQGKSYKGIVSFVSPVSDQNNNTFPVKLRVPNPDGLLRAGTVAEVTFSDQPQSRVELPKTALIAKDQKTYVYKLDNGAVHQVEIETEEKNPNWVFLKGNAPIQSGDQIVLNPSDKLADGTKVRVE